MYARMITNVKPRLYISETCVIKYECDSISVGRVGCCVCHRCDVCATRTRLWIGIQYTRLAWIFMYGVFVLYPDGLLDCEHYL